MRRRKTEKSDGVSPAPGRGRDDAARREFEEALKRLGLAVDAEDFDLALSGYDRVMREITIVRQYLAERPGASKPGGDEVVA